MTRPTRFHFAVLALLLLALALRLLGAHGELALDEIWTLKLLQPVASPDQIVWKIHHDNNHWLNSLWLYYTGPGAPVLLQRALTVALGTLGVAAAGLWGKSRGTATCLATMAIFAFSYGMVQFGSEARGYSGLILCTILAFIFCEKILNGEDRRWLLALACLLGIVCHFSMILVFAVIGLWVASVQIERSTDLVKAAWGTTRIFLPTVLCVAPVMLWMAYVLHRHDFTIGMRLPFDAGNFGRAYGFLLSTLSGIPERKEELYYLIAPCLAFIPTWRWRRALGLRFSLYLIAIALLPLIVFCLHLSNTSQPRYLMVGGTAYLLLLGDLLGIAIRRGAAIRIATAAIAMVLVGQNTDYLFRFLRDGRGHYREAVQAMTRNGPARYGTDDAFRNPMVVDFYASRLGVDATYVPAGSWCAGSPDWYLTYTFENAAPPATVTAGPSACRQTFNAPVVFPYWGLVGFQWNLYRRAG